MTREAKRMVQDGGGQTRLDTAISGSIYDKMTLIINRCLRVSPLVDHDESPGSTTAMGKTATIDESITVYRQQTKP